MPAVRATALLAAAGAALCAAAALRTAWAEWAYDREGLALGDDPEASPAADVPGRLEAFEEAARREPCEALYRLRAAQIRLRRVRRGDVDRAELAAARASLAEAARLRPMDFRVRSTMARAARLADDPAAAVSEAAAALRLAPRAPGALYDAVAIDVWAWRRARDPAYLTAALRATRDLVSTGASNPTGALATAFASAGPDLAADLAQATSGDDSLRRVALEAARATRPEVAAALGDDPR
jgi:hypothetical protein